MITPGSRTADGKHKTCDYLQPIYAGVSYTAGGLTLDPGVGLGLITGTQLTLPTLSKDTPYVIRGILSFDRSTHGCRVMVSMDGTTQLWGNQMSWTANGDRLNFCYFGPFVSIIPGDGIAHTLGIYGSDSGATGNMTFYDRWLVAIPVQQ